MQHLATGLFVPERCVQGGNEQPDDGTMSQRHAAPTLACRFGNAFGVAARRIMTIYGTDSKFRQL
jgi:hypothetical protein